MGSEDGTPQIVLTLPHSVRSVPGPPPGKRAVQRAASIPSSARCARERRGCRSASCEAARVPCAAASSAGPGEARLERPRPQTAARSVMPVGSPRRIQGCPRSAESSKDERRVQRRRSWQHKALETRGTGRSTEHARDQGRFSVHGALRAGAGTGRTSDQAPAIPGPAGDCGQPTARNISRMRKAGGPGSR